MTRILVTWFTVFTHLIAQGLNCCRQFTLVASFGFPPNFVPLATRTFGTRPTVVPSVARSKILKTVKWKLTTSVPPIGGANPIFTSRSLHLLSFSQHPSPLHPPAHHRNPHQHRKPKELRPPLAKLRIHPHRPRIQNPRQTRRVVHDLEQKQPVEMRDLHCWRSSRG
jgi:hypothetical protein